MSGWHWALVGIAIVLALAGCYVWAVRRALNTMSEWDDEDE
jgi:hypothetical protein